LTFSVQRWLNRAVKLYAISDLHVGYEANRHALEALPEYPEDWLIVGGDVGESEEQLAWTLDVLKARFQKLLWVPGNHELWTLPRDGRPRGEAKYKALVALCQARGVLTPEDPYVTWPGSGPPCVLAPLFLLYDYSFRPDEIPAERALDWAAESGLVCADESVLHPDPYPSRQAWCAARCALTEARLAAVPRGVETILINHFPLRREHAVLPFIPRFSIWCGTRRTEDWHLRFRARVVVSGHLHIRSTRFRDGVRFEEVSLGYPRHWAQERGLASYLREILPGPERRDETGRAGG
jgi:3',5'-cyclic AMP phosphodiesterase CpdA